ncbi:hypothetical protein [Persicobacter sp. CCB-QB2]|uniref:hypothetical protein n=1 Tax=Persicobacter sp. CCB-QB2 TaxID=1561025 RepID=UPI0006A9BD1D|nr:hypothetical protein [Persicobacter sp. CCB-QB2]
MPHEWNELLVVFIDEIVPDFWNNYEHLKRELHRYKDKKYGIKRARRACRGHQALILFDSLPEDVRKALGDPRKRFDHPLEQYYEETEANYRFYEEFKRPGFGNLGQEEKERYRVNAAMCEALIALDTWRRKEYKTLKKSTRGLNQVLLSDAMSFQEVLKEKHHTSHTLPSSWRGLNEKMRAYEEKGPVALIKDAEGNSLSNARKVDGASSMILEALFAGVDYKPDATEVRRQFDTFLDGYLEVVNPETGELFSPKGMKALSDSAVRSFLRSWDSSIGTLAKRQGDRQKLIQRFDPYHSLQRPEFAGSLISIDDRQPPFYYAKGKRAWFYLGIDLASEAFTTWVSGKSKEGLILEFYRQMVRNYAQWGMQIPHGLECESSLNSSYRKSFLANGAMFGDVRIEANKARAKRIEAYFRPLRYGLEKKRHGWVARPTAVAEANQTQYGQGKEVILPYEEIIEGCLRDVVTWNNTLHSDQEMYPGKTRWEVFVENQNPGLSQTPYKSFLPHLGYHSKTSCNAGIVKLQYSEWLLGNDGKIATGEELIELMRRVEGKELDVYWLNDNDGKVLKAIVYTDRYICELLPKPVYQRAVIEQTDKDKEKQSLMSAYAMTIAGYQKRRRNEIQDVVVIDNTPKHKPRIEFTIDGVSQYQAPEEDAQEMPDLADELDIETLDERPSQGRRSLDQRF